MRGKKAFFFFVCLFLLITLTSCSNGGNGDENVSEEPSQVQIPDVVGSDESTTTDNLSALNLVADVQRENANAPIGEVIAQDPAAGIFVNEGSTVSFTVSLGISVPDLNGLTESEAIQSLTDAGLNPSISYENSLTVTGQVISQSVGANTNVDPGATIDLVVSLGVSVPNVVGMSATEATDVLSGAGLTVTTSFSLNTAPVDQVFSQEPVDGSNLNPGSAVTINVSLGGVIVPDIVNLTEANAIQSLSELGLNYSVTQINSPTLIGHVVSQATEASTIVSLGTTIDFVVSSGISVPDVIGMNVTDAVISLNDSGFNIDTNVVLNPAPAEQVFAQDPAAGTNINIGSTITISVSTGGVIVPNLTGTTLPDATLQLDSLGLTYQISRMQSTEPIDSVLYQAIAPGTLVNEGTSVGLSVSDGLMLPDVIGVDVNTATNTLTALGFTVAVNEVVDDNQIPNLVFEQDPLPDTQTNGSVLVTLSVYVSSPVSTNCLTDFAALVGQIALADPAMGGQLYDNWWNATGSSAPIVDQPLWATQTTNTRTGADTWRCKECHGWDYAGNEGVYGDPTNSHYTNFPGILLASGNSAINIFCAIHSGTNIDTRHNFSEQIQVVDILHLTRFITEVQTGETPRGVIDTSIHISSLGTVLDANPTNGETLYSNSEVNCASTSCHGPNGDVQAVPLADLAVTNPWETLHKIRFGHPGSIMPAFSNPSLPAASRLTLAESKDIISYTQTLTPSQPDACVTNYAGFVSQIALADSIQGGQLYDRWWIAAGAQAPTADHPLWATRTDPAINTRTGADTWRCQECHGWDYQGVDGVYGDTSNNHYTGFPGVLAASGNAPIDVFCAIRSGAGISSAHNFTTVLSDIQILHLTKFITTSQIGSMPLGVIDTGSLISNTGVPTGANSVNGGNLYNGNLGCSSSNCHGPNGDVQNVPLGVISMENPWESLHKIRFGHPGSVPVMPSYSETSTLTELNDVLAYTQTLPTTGGGTPPAPGDASIIALGGRLYDHWIEETSAGIPPADNPAWVLQDTNTRSGADTWRCQECHGWDYKGVDGIYGDPANSHYTGFGGLLNTGLTEQQIISYLTSGFYSPILGQSVHVYDGFLTADEMAALAKFIKQGMVDSSPYFGSDALINGPYDPNFLNGQYLYSFQGFAVPTAACELCHGADGLGEQGVNVGDIARTNPWAFLHKIRFGQPNTAMPAMFEAVDANGNLIFNLQDSIDIIQYSQSLSLP